jgi:putative mRNA 3-end processing factor
MYSLTGLGACQEVGRSAFVLDFGEKFLLDYGVKIDSDSIKYPLEIKDNIKAMLLSHAHLDHSGLIPYFYEKYNCLSFMTGPTLELADILWKDAIKIAKYEGVEPKYNVPEIEKTHHFNFILPYNKKIEISPGVNLEFYDAGHILGSSLIHLSHKDKSILYTGDFKFNPMRLHNGADMSMGKVDYLIMESTYGDRDQPDRKSEEKRFAESVQETIDNGGQAIVPAFAVARAQELVDILTHYNISAPIYLDGMAQRVSKVYASHLDWIQDGKHLKNALNETIWVRNESFRKKAMKEPSVVITTSGMMQGGPVMYYVERMFKDSKSKIHLTGYQAEQTPGRELKNNGKLPLGKNGAYTKVGCKYDSFVFSAHASQNEMLKAVKKWSPKEIFLVHGDKPVMDKFTKLVKEETGIVSKSIEKGKKIEFE